MLRLAGKLNRCKRTLIYRLDDLVAAGLLKRERQGRQETNRYTFCLDGRPVIAPEQAEFYFGSNNPQPVGGDDADAVTPVEVQSVAPKILEREIIEREPPPQTPVRVEREGGSRSFDFEDQQAPPADAPRPSNEAEQAERPGSGQPSAEGSQPLNGEVLDRGITFNEFWEAGGDVGKLGPAVAAWNKLSKADLCAIADELHRNGRLELGGTWACT